MVALRRTTRRVIALTTARLRRIDTDVRWLAGLFLAGIMLVVAAPALQPLWLFLPPLLVCMVRFPGRVLIVAVVLGAAWTTWNGAHELSQRLPAAADGQIRWLHGHVEGLPDTGKYRTRFQLVGGDKPHRARISWYNPHPPVRAGQCWDLQAKLHAPHGSANPGGFDYESWLLRKRIGATGYVKSARPCPRQTSTALSVDHWRQWASQRLQHLLADSPMAGIIRALTLGDTSGISDTQWQVFRHTGTSHLVAISGLHIGLIASLVFLGLRWLTPRLPRGDKLPVMAVTAVGSALAAGLYALLAGLALPTQRALVMLLVVLGALLLRRRTAPSRLLALAALVVLAFDPFAVLSAGFWLSFGAVAWILYLVQRGHGRSRWYLAVWLQVALVLTLAPLTLFWFGQASIVAPLANAVLIPCFVVVVPVVLLSAMLALAWPAVGVPILHQVAHVMHWGWVGLQALAQLPVSHFSLPAPGAITLVLALLGVAMLLAPRGVPGRWLGAIALLPLLVVPGRPPPGDFRLVLLDVGQGLSAVVRTAGHTLLFDTGPRYRTGFDAGDALIVPYLRSRGIARVDRLVISHGDMDHSGGMQAVESQLDVVSAIGAKTATPCRAGMHWRWDGVDFVMLHPDRADWGDNNGSCVLRISAAGGSLLLTGDIEAAAEHHLVMTRGRLLPADILVMPHHGSATSSTAAFVKRVHPAYALAPAGWHNRWDFPRPPVLARYRAIGAQILQTGTAGAIRMDVSAAAGVQAPQRWRVVHRRFWQVPQPATE